MRKIEDRSGRRPMGVTWVVLGAALGLLGCGEAIENAIPNVNGSGGSAATGGLLPSGGALPTGGVVPGSGGVMVGSGGDQASGGTPVSGGADLTGGAVTGGASMTGGVAATGGEEPPLDDHVPSCVSDVSDVVMIGDSYVDWITHNFVGDLRTESGQQWPSFAIGGYAMANGGLGLIPTQFDRAIVEHPNLHTIVMTGGGNDILVADTVKFPNAGQCTRDADAPNIADCQKIVQEAVDRSKELMVETADQGVRDVVYFFYPHIPGGGLISGAYPNNLLDYALPKAREACESALSRTDGRLKCHFIDMVPVFEGKDGLFADLVSEAGDGVHPNRMGSKVMAQEVWRVMKQNCVGQPASSGCCE